MKSKYKKIKYTNTGVKAPVVTCIKSNPNLSRSDMIELNYPEIKIIIRRVSRKTMYNRAESLVGIMYDHFTNSFFVHDTINDAKVVCENLYLIIKKPELVTYVKFGEYKMIYNDMRGILSHAKES
nr:MAG TPA: hypothetical protein [Caudoviricetes sp.]